MRAWTERLPCHTWWSTGRSTGRCVQLNSWSFSRARGWWVTFASMLALTVGSPVISVGTVGVFMQPMIDDFGWSRGQYFFAFTVGGLVGSIGMLLAGMAADKFGGRLSLLVGITLYAATGVCFDSGIATSAALNRIRARIPAARAGSDGEHAQSNGGLMRILPVALMGRGLSDADARELVVAGFLDPVLGRLPSEALQAQVRAAVGQKLAFAHDMAQELAG